MNENPRLTVRAIRGPITLITVGGLFALNNFTPYSFHKTWPVILIVFGLLSLWKRTAEPEPPFMPPPAGYAPPPPGPYDPVTGAYRGPQSGPYNPPPVPSSRGGFGTSAPPRPAPEPGPENPPASSGGTV